MDEFEKRMEIIAEVCSKREFTARELFNAFDVDGDSVITKADLKLLAGSDGDKEHFSKNDLKNLYAHVGKKICKEVCQIIEEDSGNEYITIDELLKVLDKNNDGKIKFGDFLRIAKKDGDFMFITRQELEAEFKELWKNPAEQKSFLERLFD
ncbi:MAG: hypothetical protein A2Y25_04185 [Candidatus Melainabacteria bacterium GWF2_37_15]|nr:MAG: hypothetical protein A2Y25_04185 [Candidatus Melainabacteria bacterium GWF2_37_15]